MGKHLLKIYFLGMFFLTSFLNAQFGDFVRPEKAVTGFDYNVILTNYNDFKYLKSHIPEFSNIEKLRIDGAVDVNLLSEVANKLLDCSALSVLYLLITSDSNFLCFSKYVVLFIFSVLAILFF